MELFLHAEAVRLRSGDGWYLHASEGEVSATRNRSGHERNVRWSVEVVDADNIRLRSRNGKYLSGLPDFVFLSLPEDLSPSANWEPIRIHDNDQRVRLKTSGRYLCIDCNLCPYPLPSGRRFRSVSLPNRRSAPVQRTLWKVDVVELMSPFSSALSSHITRSSSEQAFYWDKFLTLTPFRLPHAIEEEVNQVHGGHGQQEAQCLLPTKIPGEQEISYCVWPDSNLTHWDYSTVPQPIVLRPGGEQAFYYNQILSEFLATEERVIFYRIADEFGNVDEGSKESNITFKGSVAHELTQRLEDKTGLRDIILCSLNALNGKLYRLRSRLPPYMNMHVVIVQSSSKFAVDSGLLHVEKGMDPEVKLSTTEKKVAVDSGLLRVEKGRVPKVKLSTDKKVAIQSDKRRIFRPAFEQPAFKRSDFERLKEKALQGKKFSAAGKQIVENMIGKWSHWGKEEKLKEILWPEGNELSSTYHSPTEATEALKKLMNKAWELKRKFDLLVMFLYPMKTNATEESVAFTVGKFPVSNDQIRRIKASILANSSSPSPFFNFLQPLYEVEKDLGKYDFDIATYPRDMVENMKDPPGIDMNYSTSSTNPAELSISSTSTKSANATRTYKEEITVSRHEIHKFTVNSAVQQVVKYFEARRNGKIGISGSGWEDVTKALKDYNKKINMFDIVQNVSLSNYEGVMQLQQNVEEVQGPSSVDSSRILLLVDYIDQRIDVDDLEFFDFADSVCIVLKTRPENVNEILALDLEIRLEDCLLPWNLFCNNVGRVLVDSYDLQQKAMRLVEECHGNLLAIILLARILKGTKDYSVWELALHEIMCQQSSQFLQQSDVILINVLRFVWERMSTDATKQNCIRYCLLQNGNKIFRKALICQGVCSGWIETDHKGEDVLKELTSSFLLENIDEYILLMRKEIRLALMNILVVGKLPFPDHGDIGPTKTPETVKWVDKERIQMNSKLSELPECPYCPSLEKLSLEQNYDLMVIPSSFFLCMPALKVLNLSYTSIRCLPKSISKLVNLEEFVLRGCHLLMELPTEIRELQKLESFDLEGTPLLYLPEEIGKIYQLRSLKITLNARASKDVSRIVPMKYLSKRTQFKELSIDVHPDGNWWDIEVKSILGELASFKCLNTLKLYLPDVEALKPITLYETTLIHPALKCFRIIVGRYCFLSRIPHELEVEFNNLEKFKKGLKYMNGEGRMPKISKLLKRVSAVTLERHWFLKNLSELGLRNMSKLKFCCLAECNELRTIIDSEQTCQAGLEDDSYEYEEFGKKDILRSIIDSEQICQADLEEDDSDEYESEFESECEEESVLSSLQYLSIHYMEKLESICRGRVSKTCLSSLKSMALHTCLSLTTIFTEEILDNLKNLKELIVEDCPEISSLVSRECSNSTSDEYLPSLKKISLLELPKLVNISNGLCIAPRLESMVIFYCPKLNKLSSTDVSSRNLDVFKGEEEWWNALEWNEQDRDHKNYLTGKFTPLSRDTDLMADLAKIRLTTTL